MVTKEEMKQFEGLKTTETKTSYKVTAAELSHFADNDFELAELVAERKKQYEKENKVSATAAYLDIEEKCHISVTSLKNAMCGIRKITRKFLYKFTVGLQMSLEEANKYFELCGGPLSRKNKEDYICLNALRDKDSIEQRVSDFEKHLELKIGFES